MDIVDRAQAEQEAQLAERLRAHERRSPLGLPGAEICADCAAPIPQERRRALPSAFRCVDCQAWAERLQRQRG